MSNSGPNSAKPLLLADFGGMKDQVNELKKFGEKLYGVEEINISIAKLADKKYAHFALRLQFKEHFIIPVLLSGLGTGKSTMLDRHLKILSEHCTNVDLKALLTRSPLVLSITFNSTMCFSLIEQDNLPEQILARRILAAYFDIRWESQKLLRLPSVPDVLRETLTLIVEHHKVKHRINATDPIAILINIDELNLISKVMDPEGGRQPTVGLSTSERKLHAIITCIRGLSIFGINGSPIFPLFAGTAHLHLVRALTGGGVEFVTKSMPVLTKEHALAALRDCFVPEQYLRNPDFLRLLDESGGIPRVIRMMLEQLTVSYDHTSILSARIYAWQYLKEKASGVSTVASLGLIPTVLLGKRVSLAQRIPGSEETFENLQSSGILWLVPVADSFAVTMPLLSLRVIINLNCLVDDQMSCKIREMLKYLEQLNWVNFENFCARFSALKMKILAQTLSSVTMRDFYGDVDMSPEVAELEIQLSADKDYCIEQFHSSEYSGFPPHAGKAKIGTKGLRTEAAAVHFLSSGRTIINVSGAPVDCIMVDPLIKGPGKILVRALCIANTQDDLELSKLKFDADRCKALVSFKACSSYRNAECITVHFTNRTVSKDIVLCSKNDCIACAENRCVKNSIVVGHHNLGAFFGPVLERGIWSNTQLARNS